MSQESANKNYQHISEGYIILARQLLNSRAWQACDSTQRGMLIYTLLRANYKDNTWFDGIEFIKIPRGSFVTGRKKFAKDTNTTERKVRTFIDLLSRVGFSTIKTTNRYSIITICNYSRYQDKQYYERPRERPRGDQATTTNNKRRKKEEGKRVKSKEKKGASPLPPIGEYFYKKYEDKFKTKYVANFGKDGKIFADILKVLEDKAKVYPLIDKFFESNDPFTIKAGFTTGVFLAQINKLQTQGEQGRKGGLDYNV